MINDHFNLLSDGTDGAITVKGLITLNSLQSDGHFTLLPALAIGLVYSSDCLTLICNYHRKYFSFRSVKCMSHNWKKEFGACLYLLVTTEHGLRASHRFLIFINNKYRTSSLFERNKE